MAGGLGILTQPQIGHDVACHESIEASTVQPTSYVGTPRPRSFPWPQLQFWFQVLTGTCLWTTRNQLLSLIVNLSLTFTFFGLSLTLSFSIKLPLGFSIKLNLALILVP